MADLYGEILGRFMILRSFWRVRIEYLAVPHSDGDYHALDDSTVLHRCSNANGAVTSTRSAR